MARLMFFIRSHDEWLLVYLVLGSMNHPVKKSIPFNKD